LVQSGEQSGSFQRLRYFTQDNNRSPAVVQVGPYLIHPGATPRVISSLKSKPKNLSSEAERTVMENQKELIRIEADRKCTRIEEMFIDSAIPVEVMTHYRLQRAIALANLNSYLSEFGYLPIRFEDAQDAALDLGWGPLSAFERSVCELINEECERRETGMTLYRPVVGLRAIG
jgi:hypothetical protein